MGAVESDSVKSAKKAKDKLCKACERASETREQTLHGQEHNRMRMASIRESRDGVWFLVNTQVQSHPMLCRGFGTSVPFIVTEVVLYFVVQLHVAILLGLSKGHCGLPGSFSVCPQTNNVPPQNQHIV